MDNEDPNIIFKALAKLKGIRANVKEAAHYTQEKYINEYNATVMEIAKASQDNLDTFLVPQAEIIPKIVSRSPSTGVKYSPDRWGETQLLLTKLDSITAYLEMLIGGREPKGPIGFRHG